MFRSIRWRITVPFAALAGISILALGFFLIAIARDTILGQLTDELFAQASLVRGLLEGESFQPENAVQLDSFARRWGLEQDLRITLISADGTVLGESQGNRSAMDNHADRPEISAALSAGAGSSIRFSDTLGFDTLYVALPFPAVGPPEGVVRLSLPLDRVEAGVDRLRNLVLLSTLIATVASVLLADIISRRTVRPLRNLIDASQKIASGESLLEPFPATRDEVGDLARSLNRMAERLRSQIDALNAEREKFSTVLEQMDSGVVMVDSGGRIALVNPAAERIFGIEGEASMGRSLVESFRLYQLVDLWEEVLADGSGSTHAIDLVSRGKAIQVIGTPLGGVLRGNTLLIFQDLTLVRRLETIRRDFISNISHELRTPLASLKALTETMLDGALEDPPAARRFLTRIETEVDSLALMVEELLELARIESGRVPLEFQAISPRTLIHRAVERLVLQAERAGLRIDQQIEPDLPPVRADPPRMQQVLMNLLHNAIKFSGSGGLITMTARRGEGERVIFSVQDTGVGIPPEDLPRIFERFFKSDRARSSGGTGLGLAISKHIVEAHGGRIWAESEPGAGSVFQFAVPAFLNGE